MKTAAPDFRIFFWDSAYADLHLGDGLTKLKNMIEACKETGNPDRVFIFGSTSKVAYAGVGVAIMGVSKYNIADRAAKLAIANIGHNKLSQLRHVRFFQSMGGCANI